MICPKKTKPFSYVYNGHSIIHCSFTRTELSRSVHYSFHIPPKSSSKYHEEKIVVSITGASGSIYAKRLLYYLDKCEDVEVGIVCSKNAGDVWRQELEEEMVLPEKFTVYERSNYFAPFASGSAKFMYMVICPCSMGTLGRIAHGISDDLTTRAADVILKERRKLICVVRDTPLNLIHIENMRTLTVSGGIILPASPSFYSQPRTFDELADTVVHRILDQLDIDVKAFRWGE